MATSHFRYLSLLIVLIVACEILNIYSAKSVTGEFKSYLAPSLPSCHQSKSHQETVTIHVARVTPKIFHCGGYAINRNFLPTWKVLFPEYQWIDLREKDWSKESLIASNPWDMFLSNYELNECDTVGFNNWLQLRFQGKVVFWTPEDALEHIPIVERPHYYKLGPGSRFPLTFLQVAFRAQLNETNRDKILDPRQRPQNTGQYFLIYAHSHCVGPRQQAFRQIANAGLPTVHYGGRCDGGVKQNETKAKRFPNKVQLRNWEENRSIYQNFRFCLVMEHVDVPGYITEKILLAFWAGCIPIYWGTSDVFDVFNPKAFVYWNVSHPSPALEQLKQLEHNRLMYEEMLNQPILASGSAQRYFSFDEASVAGRPPSYRQRLREYLELDHFLFVPRDK